MPKFAGIDSSLTNTGVVTYDTESGAKYVGSFSSSSKGNEVAHKHQRLEGLSKKVYLSVVENGIPLLVAIEGPAFSSNVGKAWDRAGLWWYIVRQFVVNGIPIIEIPPTSRSKYGTGSGRAGKDEVLLAVSRTYPDFDIKNNDESDALLLCAMAARLHGSAIEDSLPKNKLDAITKLQKDFKWET